MKTSLTLGILTALLTCAASADEARIATYTTQLRAVRVTELARETAKLVTNQADAADAVTAAVTISGPAAPLVVASVAKASPSSAAAAAGAAVKLQPQLAARITTSAVSAAPAEVEGIVGAMCKAQPAHFYSIGVRAAQAAPKASAKVLPAITTSLPALKPLVARSQAEFAAAKRAASLALVLKHTEDMVLALARQAKTSPEAILAQADAAVETQYASLAKAAPVQLPPFVPGGGTPGEINAGDTAEADPGDRDYATP